MLAKFLDEIVVNFSEDVPSLGSSCCGTRHETLIETRLSIDHRSIEHLSSRAKGSYYACRILDTWHPHIALAIAQNNVKDVSVFRFERKAFNFAVHRAVGGPAIEGTGRIVRSV